MEFHFYPWSLEIDVEATREFYENNDASIDSEANREFAGQLSEKQREFFLSLGVNPMKIRIEEKRYELPGGEGSGGGRIRRRLADFLIRGRFLAIPDFQREIYGDPEVFGDELPSALKIIPLSEEDFPAYKAEGLGLGAVFKHPCGRFDTEAFQSWDCGYILCSILLMAEE